METERSWVMRGTPAHLALDRQRDRALDLLRRLSRNLGDNQHLHVLHVGKGFDRQLGHAYRPARHSADATMTKTRC